MTVYGRTLGSVLAFLVVALVVKYAELLLTYELSPGSPGAGARLSQLWMSLRFSWQDFAFVAGLLALLAVWQHLVPAPGRWTRVVWGVLRVLLIAGAVLSVLGIRYYSMYFGHVMVTDFVENLMWALQLAASSRILESRAIPLAGLCGALLFFGLPRLCARLSPRAAARGIAAALVATAAASLVTWAAGRPRLQEAQLEPNPLVWFFWGPRATYFDLPPIEVLAPIGEQQRRFTATPRPRNVILVVLESIPAHVLTAYDPAAPAGRRLVEQFGNEITRFDQIFAGIPVSDSTILTMLTGQFPVPNNHEALKALGNRPRLAEILKARGYHNEFLLTGPRNAIIDRVLDRGFDRTLFMQSVWPNQERYARLTWGPDDRLMFDDVERFLSRQRADSPPFMLVMYTSNAHYPYQSGGIPGLKDHPDAKVRHARLSGHVMDLVSNLYASLKTKGLAGSTLMLAFGDHGQAFGERRGNYVHSKELHWENLRVPMLLLHPTRLGLPPRVAQLGGLDDVMPTVLDVLGIDGPRGSGMSLLNEAPDRLLFQMTPFGPGVVGFRDRQYFYSLSRTGREQLFDRLADPLELRNLRDERPDVAAAFRARLGRFH